MQIKNVFQTLKSSYDQLNDSLTLQSDAIEGIFNNLDNEGNDEFIDFNIKFNDIIGHVYKIISDDDNVSIYKSDNDGHLTDLIVSNKWTDVDISTIFNNVDGTSTSIQEIISNINNGYEINTVLNTVNEQLLNYGEISKDYIYALMDSSNIDPQSRLDMINIVQGYSDTIPARDWCYIVSRLYNSVASASTNSDDNQLVLNETRGSVAGFWLTVTSLDVVGTVLQYLSTILLIIPDAIVRVIGVAIGLVGSVAAKVMSYTTTYNYNDSALYSGISAPIGVNYVNNAPISGVDLIPNGPAVTITSPFIMMSVFRRRDKNNVDTYAYNANFNVSLKLSSCKRLLSLMGFNYDWSNFTMNLGSDQELQSRITNMVNSITEDDFIDYSSGEGMMDDETRARTVAANVALSLLCSHPRIHFQKYDSNDHPLDGNYIYGYGATQFFRFTKSDQVNTIVRAIHRFMYLVIGKTIDEITGYNTWGVDSIGTISDIINYIQDCQNDGTFTLVTTNGEGPIYTRKCGLVLNLGSSFCSLLAQLGWLSFGSTNSVQTLNLPQRSEFSYDLPNYSRQTVFQALMFLGTVTAATCAIIFGVRAHAKKWLFKKQLTSAAKLNAAKARYDASGSDEDLNAFYKAAKSYNFKAKILGLAGYDPVNNWYNDTGESGSSEISMLRVSRLITG